MVGRGSRHWASPRVLAKVMGTVTLGTACLVAWTRLPDADFSMCEGDEFLQLRKARMDVKIIHEAVGIHQKRTGKLPPNLRDLTTQDGHRDPLLGELPLDPWNNDYELVIETSSKWKVVSWGPDGSEGSGDDISSVNEENGPP